MAVAASEMAQGQAQTLTMVQAWSGLIFATFLSVHLLNLALATLGPGLFDSVQAILRQFYQFLPIEVVILGTLTVHLIVGLMRMRRRVHASLSTRARWHRYAGLFLALVIVGHVLAVRGSSWFYDVYPQFAGLAFSVQFAPGYFVPYYFLLALAGTYHLVHGLPIALNRIGWVTQPLSNPRLRLLMGVVALVVLAVLASFGGLLWPQPDVHQSEFARLALDLLQGVF